MSGQAATAARGPDPATVELVPAGVGDLGALARLYVALVEAHGHAMEVGAAEAKLARMLAAPGASALLFRHGGALLGDALWVEMGDHVFLRNFVLGAEWRGRGLGSALFLRLRREVWGEGREIRLEVSGPRQQAFWERQGLAVWSTGLRMNAGG